MKPAVTPIPKSSLKKRDPNAAHLKLVQTPLETTLKQCAEPATKSKLRPSEPYDADADVDDMWDNVPV